MSAGVAGVLVLVSLPGSAWVTFGLPLAGIPFWARLLNGNRTGTADGGFAILYCPGAWRLF